MTDVQHFAEHFDVLEDGAQVTTRLLELVERFRVTGKQVHDCNIVATMLAHGVTSILTHNAADFARYAPLIIVLPLVG